MRPKEKQIPETLSDELMTDEVSDGELELDFGLGNPKQALKSRAESLAGGIQIGRRVEAIKTALELNRSEGLRTSIKSMLVASIRPERILEQKSKILLEEQRRADMQHDWQVAQNYIKSKDSFYKIGHEVYLEGEYASSVRNFLAQYGIPPDFQSLGSIFGGYTSRGEFYRGRYPMTDEEKMKLLVELAQTLYKDPDISNARLVYAFNQYTGDTEYMLSSFTQVDEVELTPGVMTFVYQTENSPTINRERLHRHRFQTDPMREFENTKKPESKGKS